MKLALENLYYLIEKSTFIIIIMVISGDQW